MPRTPVDDAPGRPPGRLTASGLPVSGSAHLDQGFRHEALFYASDDEYLDGTVPFIEEGLANGEPVLVAVPAGHLELLRSRFATSSTDLLRFADMEEMGRNPAWIIPAWAAFVTGHGTDAGPARGIGEPAWPGRSDDELVECGRHEALLNLAFAGVADFRLLCPYDTSALDAAVVDAARRNHPRVQRDGTTAASEHFHHEIPEMLDAPLDPVPAGADVLAFDASSMAAARTRAGELAAAAGLGHDRVQEVMVAVSEAISNSVEHGGGRGTLALWTDGSRFLCEVADAGRITDPLAGRRLPQFDRRGGRGLWLMNQLCDLVQIRAAGRGQVIRMHIRSHCEGER